MRWRIVTDPWGAVKAWRARRDAIATHVRPTYDAYPDDTAAPNIRFYVEARDVRGRLLREYVDLEGYSVHNLDWRVGKTRGGVLVRDWFVSQMLDALIALEVRLDEEKERKEATRVSRYGQGLAEYALILALIAIVAIVALLFMGQQIQSILSEIGSQIGAQPGASGTP